MAINWDNADIDVAIELAADRTDARLASRISSLTRLTDEEIMELFPSPADVKKLKGLMMVVKSTEDRNTKVNRIVANAEEFGGVVLTLLEKLA